MLKTVALTIEDFQPINITTWQRWYHDRVEMVAVTFPVQMLTQSLDIESLNTMTDEVTYPVTLQGLAFEISHVETVKHWFQRVLEDKTLDDTFWITATGSPDWEEQEWADDDAPPVEIPLVGVVRDFIGLLAKRNIKE